MFDNKVTYIINEDKRKVICIIDKTKYNFINYISDNINEDTGYEMIYDKKQRYYMPDRFIGIATCGPDDTFNPSVGKTIAYSRAKTKLDKSFFKRANLFVNSVDNWLNRTIGTINSYGEKLSKNSEYRTNKINYMLGIDNGDETNK